MAKKGDEKIPQRPAADKLVLDFLAKNKLTLLVDTITVPVENIQNIVYTYDLRPRVRVVYQDELKKGNEEKSKLEVN